MGFGLLFFGYFAAFLMSINSYGFIFELVGYYIIFLALQKLSEYKHSLFRCIPPLAIMALCSLGNALKFILDFLQISSFMTHDLATALISALSLASSVTFHIFLFLSIVSFGKDTQLPDVTVLAKTDIFVIVLYFIANMVAMLLSSFFNYSNSYLILCATLLRIVFPLFVLALIYKCFFKICAPDDVDVPIKPSRFKFINDFRARQEKRDEETRKAQEDLTAPKKDGNEHKKKK